MGRLVFATSTEVLRVPADAVVFVTADGNYSALTTADGEDFVLVDTAGIRRKRAVEDATIERYSVIRSLAAVRRADVVLIVWPRCSMAMTIALYALARA